MQPAFSLDLPHAIINLPVPLALRAQHCSAQFAGQSSTSAAQRFGSSDMHTTDALDNEDIGSLEQARRNITCSQTAPPDARDAIEDLAEQ